MKTNVLRFPGLADRIRGRLRALGYWREDKPDVLRFAREKGYIYIYLYRWLDGVTPTYEYLVKLAEDLQMSMAELVFGEEGGERRPSPRKMEKGRPGRGKRGRNERLCQVAGTSGLPVLSAA